MNQSTWAITIDLIDCRGGRYQQLINQGVQQSIIRDIGYIFNN